jgi:hypothetical protein
MAHTRNQKGSGSKKSLKKTGAKRAKKALARAEKAVDAARKAVRRSGKKLRKRVSVLAQQTAQLSAQQARALRKLEAAARQTDVPSPPPRPADEAPSRAAEPAFVISAVPPSNATPSPPPDDSAIGSLTPPLPAPQPASLTLIELRQQARDKKIPGYYRLNKAGLIAALEAQSG